MNICLKNSGVYIAIFITFNLVTFIPANALDNQQQAGNVNEVTDLISLPNFENVQPPKDENSNNPKAIAGDKETVAPVDDKTTVQDPVITVSANTYSPQVKPVAVSVSTRSAVPTIEPDQAEVLGSKTVAQDSSAEKPYDNFNQPEYPPLEQRQKDYTYQIMAGTVLLMLVTGWITLARKRHNP